MKLHIDVKKRKAIQRSLSILLVACMVLSSGSTSAVAGGSIMGVMCMKIAAMGKCMSADWKSMEAAVGRIA